MKKKFENIFHEGKPFSKKGSPLALPFQKLSTILNTLVAKYDISYLNTDPLKFVHRYTDRIDIEVAGFVASAFAYGRVKSIFACVEYLLECLGEHPGKTALEFQPEFFVGKLSDFRYRFHTGVDAACLVYALGSVIGKYGNLERTFSTHINGDEPTIKSALEGLVKEIRAVPLEPVLNAFGVEKPGSYYFHLLPLPSSGSACKRLNLFLRWMVRDSDSLDLGIWRDVPASRLVMPLDTHTSRICYLLSLTKRKSADWRTAEEAANSLKKLDPHDPVKYDFALSRLGILGLCAGKEVEELCGVCPLNEICYHKK